MDMSRLLDCCGEDEDEIENELLLHDRNINGEVLLPPHGITNNSCFSRLSTKLLSLLHPKPPETLSWVSKETIQFLQSGIARRTGNLISVYHRGAWHRLPQCIFSLGSAVGFRATVGFGVCSGVSHSKHYKVVCFRVTSELQFRKSTEPGYYIDWSLYSSKTQLWAKKKPINIGVKHVLVKNLVISKDGRRMYLIGNRIGTVSVDIQEHCKPSRDINIDTEKQRSCYLPFPRNDIGFYEEFAIARWWSGGLCMIKYSGFSMRFSVWITNQWMSWKKIHEVSIEDTNFDSQGTVECFACLKRYNMLVMAMNDGNIYSYNFETRYFTKLNQSLPSIV